MKGMLKGSQSCMLVLSTAIVVLLGNRWAEGKDVQAEIVVLLLRSRRGYS